MLIKRAEQNDVPEMLYLLEELFCIEEDFVFDAEKARTGLELILKDLGKSCIMLAEEDDKIIGMASVQLLVSTAEGGYSGLVEDVVVAKPFRGRGIGKQMLIKLEEWAKSRGAARLQLLADKNNTPALDFYKKNSWNSTALVCLRKKDF